MQFEAGDVGEHDHRVVDLPPGIEHRGRGHMHPQPLAVALADQGADFMGLATEHPLQFR
ncbi:hypothetical protein D3C78_1752190 [compost metagenome]